MEEWYEPWRVRKHNQEKERRDQSRRMKPERTCGSCGRGQYEEAVLTVVCGRELWRICNKWDKACAHWIPKEVAADA